MTPNPTAQDPRAWIVTLIRDICAEPANNLQDGSGERAWGEPLVGFCRGDDPIYDQYKEVVGPFHWTPAEVFAAVYPLSPIPPEELTVIAWILPQTEATKAEHRRQTEWPNERWARSRIYGEAFNTTLRQRVAASLSEAGYAAVAPHCSPDWRSVPSERFVFVTGVKGLGLDTIVVMTVGQEFELLQTVDQPTLTEHIRRAVFHRVLNLATSLAAEGREGKPVGALFVVGDSQEVTKASQQMILNPFHGYPERQRQILSDDIAETIREYSALDGAFVIKGNGVVVSAGTCLRPGVAGDDLPRGLGARHAAAAGITASTKSIALTVSESTGTVRIWRGGKLITEIERAQRQAGSSLPGPQADL